MSMKAERKQVPETCLRSREVFARNIRAWANARGISINTLADRSGVSRAQMFNVLKTNSSPSLDWINKVAPVLGLQSWELLVDGPIRTIQAPVQDYASSRLTSPLPGWPGWMELQNAQ